MKIAILGYGKMGREIEKMALERGHEISLIIDNDEDWAMKKALLSNSDVALDFSMPECAVDNIKRCFLANVPVVTGTTGWHDQIESIKELCLNENQALFWAPNFSIGVNLFFALNQYLATLMKPYEDYDLYIEETHHTQKKDAPSGTAIALAQDIMNILSHKTKWCCDEAEGKHLLNIRSNRIPDVTGVHKVIYESPVDSIRISHVAKNRLGFVQGALLAAEWLQGKTGFYTMKDLLETIQTRKTKKTR
jgi:4-hydroxy-tetrahydrodipicolinate reductase